MLCLIDSTWSIIDPLRIFRPTRLVRCYFLIERSGRVRRVLKSLLRAAPVIGNVLFLLLIHVLTFGFLGWMLFAHLEREDPSGLGCRSADERTVLDGTEKCYFQDLNAAFINLFILLTNANFPDIMMPSYRTNRWSFLFFVAFLLIGLYLLMQLVLAVIFHTFKNHTVRDVNYYAQRADRAFRAAFYLLGSVEARAALIHLNSWLHIMREMRPELNAEQARIMFRAVKATPHKPEAIDAAMRKQDAATAADGLRRRSSAHSRRASSAAAGAGGGGGGGGVMEDEVNSVTYEQFKDLCQLLQVRFVAIEDPSEQWRYAPPPTPTLLDHLASPSSLPHHAHSPPLPRLLPQPPPLDEEKTLHEEADDADASLLTIDDSSSPSHLPTSPSLVTAVSAPMGDTSILDEVDRSSDDEEGNPAEGRAEEEEEEEEEEELRLHLHRLTCPSFIHPALAWLTAHMQGILTRRTVDLVVDVLCTFSTIIIIVQAELVHIEGEGKTQNEADANTVTFLTVIHSLIFAAFLVEMAVKLAVMRASYFRSGFRATDLFLLFLSAIGQLLWYAGTMITPSFYLRPLRLLRLGRGLRRLKAILHTLTLMLPALTPLLVLQLLVFYVFAVLGMAFFAKRVNEVTVPVSSGLDYAINDYYANTFDDVLQSYVTLFELLIGNNCTPHTGTPPRLPRFTPHSPLPTHSPSSPLPPPLLLAAVVPLACRVLRDGRVRVRDVRVCQAVLHRLLLPLRARGHERADRVRAGGVPHAAAEGGEHQGAEQGEEEEEEGEGPKGGGSQAHGRRMGWGGGGGGGGGGGRAGRGGPGGGAPAAAMPAQAARAERGGAAAARGGQEADGHGRSAAAHVPAVSAHGRRVTGQVHSTPASRSRTRERPLSPPPLLSYTRATSVHPVYLCPLPRPHPVVTPPHLLYPPSLLSSQTPPSSSPPLLAALRRRGRRDGHHRARQDAGRQRGAHHRGAAGGGRLRQTLAAGGEGGGGGGGGKGGGGGGGGRRGGVVRGRSLWLLALLVDGVTSAREHGCEHTVKEVLAQLGSGGRHGVRGGVGRGLDGCDHARGRRRH